MRTVVALLMLVTVPTIDNSFTSVLRFGVALDLHCDVVLGRDWIGLSRAVMTDGLAISPLRVRSLLDAHNPVNIMDL